MVGGGAVNLTHRSPGADVDCGLILSETWGMWSASLLRRPLISRVRLRGCRGAPTGTSTWCGYRSRLLISRSSWYN